MAATNRRWVLRERPQGMPRRADFELREEPLPQPGDGEFVVRNLYLSCDPAQRSWLARDSYVPKIAIGETMRAGAAGQVVASRHAQFKQGDVVFGMFGWQDYALSDGRGFVDVSKLPPGVPIPLCLSALGLTGLTAYYGMVEVGAVQAGQHVLVSGAAGATGSVAAQIAKIHGARVVGIAGGPKKCEFLTRELGLDASIDHRGGNLPVRLKELFPRGIDVFFDNVGGETLDTVLLHLAPRARVVMCGAISVYNDLEHTPPLRNYNRLMVVRARMEGILVTDYTARFTDAARQLGQWVGEGRVRSEVDIVEGLEQAPEALARLFTGANVGKQLVRL
ncbi:MAG: NADP-dependent oxidoreductase [Gammaproteobacteria bacterium]